MTSPLSRLARLCRLPAAPGAPTSRPSRPAPQLECLEERTLLAADFNATYSAALAQGLLGQDIDDNTLGIFQAAFDAGATRGQVVQALTAQPFFRMHEIDLAYQQVLGRHADPAGLSTYLGFLGVGGTIEQVRASLAGSDEFFFRAGSTANGFLDALFQQDFHRGLDDGGAAFFGGELAAGAPRSAVALQLLQSIEALDTEFIDTFHAVLNRNPTIDDGTTLAPVFVARGDDPVVVSLLSSDEFAQRVQNAINVSGTDDPNVTAALVSRGQDGFLHAETGQNEAEPLEPEPGTGGGGGGSGGG